MPAQPSNSWTLQQASSTGALLGQPQTLASLGIDSAEYGFNNMAADVFTFTVGGRAFDASALFPYGTLLALCQPDGTRRFFGRVEPWTRQGTPDAQDHLGRLVGPWWYLTQKIYEQSYGAPVITNGNFQSWNIYTTPRVVLNVLYDATAPQPGTPGQPPVTGHIGFYSATTGQQIADAVNWAIAQGAPIKLGTVDPDTQPFSDFQKGITCADVIKLMFRKEPDFVMDWDYTTTPFPTLHFRKSGKSLTPLTIDLTTKNLREAVTIKERPDWQRSYVKINYDQTNSNSSGQYLSTFADWYSALGQGVSANGSVTGAALPADTESKFRGVDLFCDLTGSSSQTTKQTAVFASKSFDITSLATWLEWKPALDAGTVARNPIFPALPAVVILTANTNPPADQNRPAPTIVTVNELNADGNVVAYNPGNAFEVVDGEWADWIPGVSAQRVRVTAWAKITQKNGATKFEQLTKEMTVVSRDTGGIPTEFTATATNYTQYAEAVPNGLAKAMWTSWQNLALEGSIKNVSAVVGTAQTISRSNCLNFQTNNAGANGLPDWRNVNALVQHISGNIANGAETIEFGAPLYITGNDLIDAVRATRYRVTTIDLGYLFGGSIGGGTANVKCGQKTHARSVQHGATHREVDVVSAAVLPVAGVDPVVKTDGTTGISTWVAPQGPTTGVAPVVVSKPVITLDPAKCMGSDGNWHEVDLREQKVCVKIGGVLKQRTTIVPSCAYFKAPDDPA